MIVIMGVSGCGKTTIGKLLSQKTGLPFYDTDDFHTKANIEKMKNGIPLDDTDRQPWLESLSNHIKTCEANGSAILACSALNEKYRETLSSKINIINGVSITLEESIYDYSKS